MKNLKQNVLKNFNLKIFKECIQREKVSSIFICLDAVFIHFHI